MVPSKKRNEHEADSRQGPSIVEPQAEWIVDVMKRMRSNGQTKINAKRDYELEWKKLVNEMHSMTLRHNVDSWYMGRPHLV